jgi:hypothetical protein
MCKGLQVRGGELAALGTKTLIHSPAVAAALKVLLHPKSEGFSAYDLAVVDEELCGAQIGATDYGKQPGELLPRDQAEGAAFGTREHRPVGIVFLSHVASVFQHKDRAGLHLFGDPLA